MRGPRPPQLSLAVLHRRSSRSAVGETTGWAPPEARRRSRLRGANAFSHSHYPHLSRADQTDPPPQAAPVLPLAGSALVCVEPAAALAPEETGVPHRDDPRRRSHPRLAET